MRNFKKWITHNSFLKIISAFIAIGLWIYVSFVLGANIIESSIYQIQFRGLNPNYAVSLSTEQVEVRFEAPKNYIESRSKEISVHLDLADLEPGTYKIKPVVKTPSDVTVTSYEPEYIEVTLDTIITKEFPVKPILSGNLQSGNIAGEPTVTPATVQITGPESIISTLQSIIAEVDTTNANADIFSHAQVIALNEENEEVAGITIEPKTVQVTIPVLNTDITKVLPVIPSIKGSPLGVIKSIQVDPYLITVSGDVSVIEQLTSLSTSDIIVDGLNSSIEKDVQILLPEGVQARQNQIVVHVSITIEPYSNVLIEGIPITIQNLPFDLEYTLNFNAVSIQVFGLMDVLNSIQDVKAHIDVKGLDAGTYTLPVVFENIPDSVIIQAFPKSIEVTLISSESL